MKPLGNKRGNKVNGSKGLNLVGGQGDGHYQYEVASC